MVFPIQAVGQSWHAHFGFSRHQSLVWTNEEQEEHFPIAEHNGLQWQVNLDKGKKRESDLLPLQEDQNLVMAWAAFFHRLLWGPD